MLLGDYTVPGKNLHVAASFRLERKDLSGQGAVSSFATGGDKPKELAVSTQIPFDEAGALTELLDIAQALESDGNPVIYEIVDELAAAMKIRKVVFAENFSAKKNDALLVFDVSFLLREVATIPEKREANVVESQAGAGGGEGVVAIAATDPEKVNSTIRQVTQ